jgi:hypothetical protein
MSIEFVIERNTGGVDRLERDELIAEMADDLRNDLQDSVEDQVSEFESYWSSLSDDNLAHECRKRTGEMVRIEESEEE